MVRRSNGRKKRRGEEKEKKKEERKRVAEKSDRKHLERNTEIKINRETE